MVAIEIMVAVLFAIEARIEFHIIAMKSEAMARYKYHDREEHRWSLIWAISFVAMIAVAAGVPALIPSLLFSRRLFFDYPLKLFRGRSMRVIEGGGWFDRMARKTFGYRGGWIEAAAVVVIKAAAMLIYLKFI